MSKNFSIDKAAKDTAVNTNPGILAKFFKNRLHAQFEKIKHGCIVPVSYTHLTLPTKA